MNTAHIQSWYCESVAMISARDALRVRTEGLCSACARSRKEKKTGKDNSLTARLHRPAPPLQAPVPCFFAFTVPIKDYKMWNWPINEKRLHWWGFIWILGRYWVGYFSYFDHDHHLPIGRHQSTRGLWPQRFVTLEHEDISDSREKQLTDIWHSSDVSCGIFFWKQNYHNWFSNIVANWYLNLGLFLQIDYQEFPQRINLLSFWSVQMEP